VLNLVRSLVTNLKLEEVTRNKGPSNWVLELEGVRPQRTPLVKEKNSSLHWRSSSSAIIR